MLFVEILKRITEVCENCRVICRFIHPIVYGEYPKTMQNIVGNRLPKFTKEEVKMVKGSIDFVGINQYTAYYMYDPHLKQPKQVGYQQDWNAGFACKSFIYFCLLEGTKKKTNPLIYRICLTKF